MSLSPDQAADSLKEIEKTSLRSASAYSYANSSPYFLLWGVIWMIGYAGSDLMPQIAGYLWMGLTVLGFGLSMVIGCATRPAGDPVAGRQRGWRFFASFLAIYLFVVASFTILMPISTNAQAAFVPLVVALFYSLAGIWKGVRFLVAGIAVAALTLGGFFLLHEHFLLWMAGVGGGALVLAGLWLRKV